jgi:sugar phosphate isomerase/epimerase
MIRSPLPLSKNLHYVSRVWRQVPGILCLFSALAMASPSHAAGLFDKSNLVAWCIVPFDAKKRSPEERAAMLAQMGLTRFAYDWRAENVPGFEREILACQAHGIEFFAFWDAHDEAIALFKKHGISPQLWVMLRPAGETQEERVASSAGALLPLLEKAKSIGGKVGLYNHGAWPGDRAGWGGEPENMVAVCEYLQTQHAVGNIGIVYNLHHGHAHLDRLPAAIELMKPHLLCFNLNGMDLDGDKKGRKILPLGVGTEDVQVLRQLRDSGYNGPVGILNHTDEDAEGRLLDNLDGLHWLLPQLDGAPPAPKPTYRTWRETNAEVGR